MHSEMIGNAAASCGSEFPCAGAYLDRLQSSAA